jgi:hypothetical protein
MTASFGPQMRVCQFSKIVVQERDELVERPIIADTPPLQQPRQLLVN